MPTDWTTVSKSGSVTGLSDWSMDRGTLQEHARSLSPEEVFERDYERLVQALTLVAGGKEAAADAVQEAFVRLVRGWDRLSTYEDPAGWVRRVALNQIRDHHRSVWRQARLLLKMEREDHPSPETATTDEQLWGRLRVLPYKQRVALALYYLDHLTTREVADVMHVSEGTVKQHLHRARESLKEVYEEARHE